MRTAPSKNSRRVCGRKLKSQKAWIAQAEAGERGAQDEAYQALARMHRHYLCHPVHGGWYDQIGIIDR
jgi:hypothetical protein